MRNRSYSIAVFNLIHLSKEQIFCFDFSKQNSECTTSLHTFHTYTKALQIPLRQLKPFGFHEYFASFQTSKIPEIPGQFRIIQLTQKISIFRAVCTCVTGTNSNFHEYFASFWTSEIPKIAKSFRESGFRAFLKPASFVLLLTQKTSVLP